MLIKPIFVPLTFLFKVMICNNIKIVMPQTLLLLKLIDINGKKISITQCT